MKALVIGAAPAVAADLAALRGWRFGRIYGVNGAPLVSGVRPDVWVTGHAEAMEEWQTTYRRLRKRRLPEISVSAQRLARIGGAHHDRVIPAMVRPVKPYDSGLLAVHLALLDGATRVIVAGCPLDDTGNLNGTSPVGHPHQRYRAAWWWARGSFFGGRVRGMSGYPAALLGVPDERWWADGGDDAAGRVFRVGRRIGAARKGDGAKGEPAAGAAQGRRAAGSAGAG